MASYFRIFWRRGRQRQELPPAVPLTGAPAPPGEPVSAWTPHFKRTDNATNRRVPEENPHNPEHPATPPVAFFIAAVEPATSIKRRDIRRIAIPSPFHYGEIVTARVTHIAASVLYGQGPPTARATHLTASVLYVENIPTARSTHLSVAVLYRAPRSQGHPETTPVKKGKKKKWGYIGGDTSTSRRRLRLQPHDVFPITPPGFFAGQWPSHKPFPTFRTSFTRRLQTPLELNEYPPAPPTTIPFAALDLLLEANVVEFNRQIQKLPHNPEYPATPPGFRWPRPPFPTFKVEFIRTRRDLAHNPAYPATPPGFRWPRPPMPTLKASFTRALQPLAHNPAYPPTPPRFFEGFFPAPIRLKRIPSTYHRESQSPLELDERPPTPPGFFEGHWPAPVPFPTFKVSFARARQTLPELDRYKPPPVSDENYAGYTPVLTFRVSFKRTLQVLAIPPEYPPTPPGFRWPRPPMPAFKVSFKRTIQTLELNERPPTPPRFFEGFFPAPFRVKRIALTYHREAQQVLNPHVYPPTPPGFRWPRPPMPTFRTSFKRNLQIPLEIDEYPPAAAVVIPPAALDLLLKANRVEFKRQIQKLPPHPEDAPETPVDIVPFVTPSPQRNRRHSGRFF